MCAALSRGRWVGSCVASAALLGGCTAAPKAGQPVVNPPVLGGNTGATRASSAVYSEPDVVDLGDRLWKEHVPFTLTVYKVGPAPVTIPTLKTSCGCTVFDSSEWVRATIPPQGVKNLTGLLATEHPGETASHYHMHFSAEVRHGARTRGLTVAGAGRGPGKA